MLAKSKIRELNMAFFINKDIVWLQISMNEVHSMNWFDRKDRLSDVKSTLIFAKNVLPDKECHKVTSGYKIHDEVKILVILETKLQLYYPNVFGFHKDLPFRLDMSNLVLAYHLLLLHPLYCDYFTTFDVSADSNLAECSSTNDREWFKVPSCDLFPHFTIEFSFFVQYILLDELLFSHGKIQLLHFLLEYVPCLFPIWLIFLKPLIFGFNIGLGRFCSILHSFGNSILLWSTRSGLLLLTRRLLLITACSCLSRRYWVSCFVWRCLVLHFLK